MTKLSNQPTSPTVSGEAYKSKPSLRSRNSLSGDTSTGPIVVTGITHIHTTTDYAFDEVFLWAANHDATTDRELSISVVSSSTPSSEAFSSSHTNNTFILNILNKEGLQQFYPGIPHKQVSIYASASLDNKINVFGYVDRHYLLDVSDQSIGYDGGST